VRAPDMFMLTSGRDELAGACARDICVGGRDGGFARAAEIICVAGGEGPETLEWDGLRVRAQEFMLCGLGRDLVIFIAFEAPSMSATRSAMPDPTELRWKVRPGNSFS
jgi:hypothetical protein